jgi:hypothetical protein
MDSLRLKPRWSGLAYCCWLGVSWANPSPHPGPRVQGIHPTGDPQVVVGLGLARVATLRIRGPWTPSIAPWENPRAARICCTSSGSSITMVKVLLRVTEAPPCCCRMPLQLRLKLAPREISLGLCRATMGVSRHRAKGGKGTGTGLGGGDRQLRADASADHLYSTKTPPPPGPQVPAS